MDNSTSKRSITTSTVTDEQIHSNLVLQILLSINVRLAPVWLIANTLFVWNETPDWDNWTFDGTPGVIRYALIMFASLLVMLLECFRMYFGYSGNLREQVPDFAAFLILSTFFSLPSHVYLLYAKWSPVVLFEADHHLKLGTARQTNGWPWQAMNLTVQSIILLWITAEICVGIFTIRRLSRIRAQQYFLEHFVQNKRS